MIEGEAESLFGGESNFEMEVIKLIKTPRNSDRNYCIMNDTIENNRMHY